MHLELLNHGKWKCWIYWNINTSEFTCYSWWLDHTQTIIPNLWPLSELSPLLSTILSFQIVGPNPNFLWQCDVSKCPLLKHRPSPPLLLSDKTMWQPQRPNTIHSKCSFLETCPSTQKNYTFWLYIQFQHCNLPQALGLLTLLHYTFILWCYHFIAREMPHFRTWRIKSYKFS
jgi:hypothetical protein